MKELKWNILCKGRVVIYCNEYYLKTDLKIKLTIKWLIDSEKIQKLKILKGSGFLNFKKIRFSEWGKLLIFL